MGEGKLDALAPHLTSYPSLPSLPIALNLSLFAEAGTGSGIATRLAFAAVGPSSAARRRRGKMGLGSAQTGRAPPWGGSGRKTLSNPF